MKATIEIKELRTLMDRVGYLEQKYETLEGLFNNHSLYINEIQDLIDKLIKEKK